MSSNDYDLVLTDYLNPEDLCAPLPAHNTIELINNLTPTQACMAMHVLLYEADKYYLYDKAEDANEPLELLKGTNTIPVKEEYLGILYSNNIILHLLALTWHQRTAFDNIEFSLKNFYMGTSTEIPYENLAILFKEVFRYMITEKIDNVKNSKSTEYEKLYKYIYGNDRRHYNILHLNNYELMNHKYLVDRYFDENHNLLVNSFLTNDLLFFIHYCVIYMKYNILDVKDLLDKMYSYHLKNSEMKKYCNTYLLLNKKLNNYPIDIINLELSIFSEFKFEILDYRFLIRGYIFYIITKIENITGGKEKIVEIFSYLKDYFSELVIYEINKNMKTRDNYNILLKDIMPFFVGQKVWHFYEIVQYLLQKNDQTIPLSWQIEEYLNTNPLTSYKNVTKITYKEFKKIALL